MTSLKTLQRISSVLSLLISTSQTRLSRGYRENGGPVPSARSHTPTVYFHHQVHKLCVVCRHKERGCGWEGELSALEHHVESCSWKNSPDSQTVSSVILMNNYTSTVSVNGADIVAKVTFQLFSGKTYSTKKHGINLKAPADALESNTTLVLSFRPTSMVTTSSSCVIIKHYYFYSVPHVPYPSAAKVMKLPYNLLIYTCHEPRPNLYSRSIATALHSVSNCSGSRMRSY